MSDTPQFDQKTIKLLKSVEQRKVFLEEIAQLVTSLRRLSTSLESIFRKVGADNPLIEKAFDILDIMDSHHQKFSNEKIEFRLESLDFKIRDELSYFLQLVNKAGTEGQADLWSHPRSEEDSESVAVLYKRIDDFKRKMKLSFAYRVLLCERGAGVSQIDLDVAPELISLSIVKLMAKEKQYRDKLIRELSSFHKNVVALLSIKEIPEGFKEVLKFTVHQIKENMQYLKAGKSIEEVPTSFESINIDMLENIVVNTLPEKRNDDAVENRLDQKEQSNGFFKRVNAWLDAPIDVEWKNIKK